MATKDTGGGQQKATRSTEEVEEQAQDAQASEDLKERQERLGVEPDEGRAAEDGVAFSETWECYLQKVRRVSS